VPERSGSTALHIAAMNGNTQMILLLLNTGGFLLSDTND